MDSSLSCPKCRFLFRLQEPIPSRFVTCVSCDFEFVIPDESMEAEEAGFIQRIISDPSDDTARLIYADWLEERNDPRASVLRTLCRFDRMAETDPERSECRVELIRLPIFLKSDWLAKISRVPIELCPVEFAFKCPKRWENLKPTDQSDVRYCESCRKNVYFSASLSEAQSHARKGECVAISSNTFRFENDLNSEFDGEIWMGEFHPEVIPVYPREVPPQNEISPQTQAKKRWWQFWKR